MGWGYTSGYPESGHVDPRNPGAPTRLRPATDGSFDVAMVAVVLLSVLSIVAHAIPLYRWGAAGARRPIPGYGDRRPIPGQKEKGADAIGAAPSRQSVVQSFRNDSVRMGLRGVEPLTSRLSGVRSNQLSYRPLPEHDKLVTPTRSGQPRRGLHTQWNPGH